MMGLGLGEMLVTGLLILVLFDAERLSRLAGSLGRLVRRGRRLMAEISQVFSEDEDDARRG